MLWYNCKWTCNIYASVWYIMIWLKMNRQYLCTSYVIQLQTNSQYLCISYVCRNMIANKYAISMHQLCISWYDYKWICNICVLVMYVVIWLQMNMHMCVLNMYDMIQLQMNNLYISYVCHNMIQMNT